METARYCAAYAATRVRSRIRQFSNKGSTSSSTRQHNICQVSMATPRLPFLWPMLWSSAEAATPAVRSARAASRIRSLHQTTRRKQHQTVAQRYGTAQEPSPGLLGGKSIGPTTQQNHDSQSRLPKIGEKLQKDGEDEAEQAQTKSRKPKDREGVEPTATEENLARPIQPDPMVDSAAFTTQETTHVAHDKPIEKSTESLLDSLPEPLLYQKQDVEKTSKSSEEPSVDPHPGASFDDHAPSTKAPHIEPPRHVHHFDTYSLVKQLSGAGWDPAQSISIMKGMRVLLTDNMDLAREALISKSNVENETYLFRAACAELKTEIVSRRKAEVEKMRTERNQLQHEVDILAQRVGQESAGLKDELKGMFDDRKMIVRNEQREMESKVQQLNYKITVSLQADARSDVEGLRWIVTRRVIIALGIIVIMILFEMRLMSNSMRDAEVEAKKRPKSKSGALQMDEEIRNPANGNGSGEMLMIPEAELSAAG